jgi:hypothetical protein
MDRELASLYLEVWKAEVLPFLEDYWKDVVRKREEEDTWHTASPFKDCFKVFVTEDPTNRNLRIPEMAAIIPAPRSFWDCILALYTLENDKVFPSTAVVAKCILQEAASLKIPLEGYLNFTPRHLQYLIEMANGKEENRFFTDIKGTLCMLKVTPLIQSGWTMDHAGYEDPVTWSQKHPPAVEQISKFNLDLMKKFDEKWEQRFIDHRMKNLDLIDLID